MKIAINKCHGGFNLSHEASVLYAKKSGFEIFAYSFDGCKVESPNEFGNYSTKDFGPTITNKELNATYWSGYDIERDDPILCAVIEELGTKKASGKCASVEVVEIPDDVIWDIDEHAGYEKVREVSRSWG